jgi:hypothetical protein
MYPLLDLREIKGGKSCKSRLVDHYLYTSREESTNIWIVVDMHVLKTFVLVYVIAID